MDGPFEHIFRLESILVFDDVLIIPGSQDLVNNYELIKIFGEAHLPLTGSNYIIHMRQGKDCHNNLLYAWDLIYLLQCTRSSLLPNHHLLVSCVPLLLN